MCDLLFAVAAYVLQDGQEHLPVPWEEIDAVFIGGSTAWKLGPHAARLVAQARARSKHCHLGRVKQSHSASLRRCHRLPQR